MRLKIKIKILQVNFDTNMKYVDYHIFKYYEIFIFINRYDMSYS